MIAVSFGSYATSLFVGDDAVERLEPPLHHARGAGDGGRERDRNEGRRRRPVADRHRRARRLPRVHLGDDRDVDWSLLSFSGYPSVSKIISSVALTFFAFLGFNVITFTAGDLENPAHDLPRAMYRALGITTVVYVLIAIGVFGTLTVDRR